MSDEKSYLEIRLQEIEKEINAPRPSASMDCRHDDWGDGRGSYWGRLYEERRSIVSKLGKNAPDKYLSSEEKFKKYGKSPMMLAQEHAANELMKEKL